MSPRMEDQARTPRPFPVAPPFIFAGSYAAGVALQWLAAWPPRWIVPGWAVAIGVAAMIGAFGAGLAMVLNLRRHETTVNPAGEPRFLLLGGPYRLSRNPIYLALTLTYLGATLIFGSLWPLLLLAVPLAILDRRVIPYEEHQLEAAFGDSYRAYRARTRRWL